MRDTTKTTFNLRETICIALGCFLVGAGAGAGVGYYVVGIRLFNSDSIGTLTERAGADIGQLKMLRAGKSTNVIELLEVNLDGNLMGLGGFLQSGDELKNNPQAVEILQRANDYRRQYPHTSGSSLVDDAAAASLRLVDEKKTTN